MHTKIITVQKQHLYYNTNVRKVSMQAMPVLIPIILMVELIYLRSTIGSQSCRFYTSSAISRCITLTILWQFASFQGLRQNMHTSSHTLSLVTLAHRVCIIIITFSLLHHNIHFIYYKCGFVHYNLHCNILKIFRTRKQSTINFYQTFTTFFFFNCRFFLSPLRNEKLEANESNLKKNQKQISYNRKKNKIPQHRHDT